MNLADSLQFKSIGQDVIIWDRAKIANSHLISIGNSVIIDDFVLIIGAEGTRIGDFVHISSFSSIVGNGEFIIDDFAGLSGGVRVYTANEDYSGKCMTNPTVPYPFRMPTRSYVRLAKHSIVGANSVILPGVEIGEGAVVGANSLVTKSCEPWTIYVGSPAKPIKKREKEIILSLEKQLRQQFYDGQSVYIPKKKRLENKQD